MSALRSCESLCREAPFLGRSKSGLRSCTVTETTALCPVLYRSCERDRRGVQRQADSCRCGRDWSLRCGRRQRLPARSPTIANARLRYLDRSQFVRRRPRCAAEVFRFVLRSQSNDGCGADSGPSRGDPCRSAIAEAGESVVLDQVESSGEEGEERRLRVRSAQKRLSG